MPEKIVYTDTFVDADGNPIGNIPEILVTMTFIEQEGKTKVITLSQFASNETLQQVKDMGVVEGFASQFDRLGLLLEDMKLLINN
ncbi:SRPBCC domain-containing protein [Neobacillus massiliamazoniensis]|uniref:Activator of Hsp90 ATPase 1 family protein n=1 Tax=Neobacillus massiliamazoniensis TaxID=1499688 RepID=A0A0U1NY15_9BACI|nr:SRPBCC domain-containing protein [Neobacillus massiliamazoniensis]CRK82904.1 activator of Hsp90 ATPase 1 family protein [Neobacillus massiliamazoniensis]